MFYKIPLHETVHCDVCPFAACIYAEHLQKLHSIRKLPRVAVSDKQRFFTLDKAASLDQFTLLSVTEQA